MPPKEKKGEMGNRFVYWGMSFVFLRCGMLSQVWASMCWFSTLLALSMGLLLLFTVAAILERRTWDSGGDW